MRNKRIISYSLFKPFTLYNEREWDRHRANARRYWYNLPAIAICNHRVYEDFETRVYVSANCRDEPLFEVLELLTELVPGFNFVIIDTPYEEFEPAMWRMAPFWDADTEILLCRDLDSIPNGTEWGATRLFLQENAGMHSIRSHPHHREPLRLLGGLCGFRPARFEHLPGAQDFDGYLALAGHTQRNTDQEVLNAVFAQDPALTATELLDSPIDGQTEPAAYPCRHAPPQGSMNVNARVFRTFKWVQDERLTPWAGAPCNARGAKLMRLLKLSGFTTLLHALRRNPHLKRFYLPKSA